MILPARWILCAALAALPAAPSACPAADPPPDVLSVHDGDTYRVREITVRLAPASIRLAGLDAPELGQPGPWGAYARDRLAAHLAAGGARVEVIDLDPYGRPLATVRAADGRDVGVDLVGAGLAYAWVPAGGRRPADWAELIEAERWARATGVGVWSDPGAVAPWVWRAAQRR